MTEEIPSPCVSVCRMDLQRTFCEGCLRSIDEIRAWRASTDVEKKVVWARIAERATTLGSAARYPSAMKHISFYLDFISPYAYGVWWELPQALMGLSYSVTYKPLLFAALLKHHGQLGPAEIPSSVTGPTGRCSGWPKTKATRWTCLQLCQPTGPAAPGGGHRPQRTSQPLRVRDPVQTRVGV